MKYFNRWGQVKPTKLQLSFVLVMPSYYFLPLCHCQSWWQYGVNLSRKTYYKAISFEILTFPLKTSKPTWWVPCLCLWLGMKTTRNLRAKMVPQNLRQSKTVQRLWNYSVRKIWVPNRNAWKGQTGQWPCCCTSVNQDGSTELEMEHIIPVVV